MGTTRVVIRVNKMHCGNTEDVHGADEFYAVSSLTTGKPEETQASIMGPFNINDNQERFPDHTLYHGLVDDSAVIRGGITAFDEDFAKDWENRPAWIEQIKSTVIEGLKSSSDPFSVSAGYVLDLGYSAFDFFASNDKDDQLGRLELKVPAQGPHKETKTWHFWKDGSWYNPGYSTWNYSVNIEVLRAPMPSITAVWRPGTPNNFEVWAWTYEDFVKKYDELLSQNLRIQWHQAYVHPDGIRYDAAWRPGTTNDVALWGWTREDLLKKLDELVSQNFRLHSFQAYPHPDGTRYDAVLRPGTTNDVGAWGLYFDEFVKKYDEMISQEFRLELLNVFPDSSGIRYDGVFRPGTSNDARVFGWTYEDFRERYDQLWPQGSRLHILQVYRHPDGIRYDAVWRPSDSGEIQVYGWPDDQFHKKNKEMREKGWALEILERA